MVMTSAWPNGPLMEFETGFLSELVRLGYTAGSARNQVRLMRRLATWLEHEAVQPGDIGPDQLERFVASGAASGASTLRALAPLLNYLRHRGICAEPAAPISALTGIDTVLGPYERYLVQDRGLSARTVRRRVSTARRLLSCTSSPSDLTGVRGVTAAPIRAFLLDGQARGVSVASLRLTVDDLRSFLRFLYVKGWTGTDLTGAVPAVAGWRNARLPSTLEPVHIAALLASCDRSRRAGRRDLPILLLLARLGLRAAEVACLELDDLRWRQAEIVVRGKGRRSDRLPLPAEVGEAIAAYLAERPKASGRAVFVTCRAPVRPLHPVSVGGVVRRACIRAGIAVVGAHRLRHSLATELLGRGSNLVEIGQVLRHHDLATTAVYAKVEHVALRTLALPWPEVER